MCLQHTGDEVCWLGCTSRLLVASRLPTSSEYELHIHAFLLSLCLLDSSTLFGFKSQALDLLLELS